MLTTLPPTPHPDVNQILDLLYEKVRGILSDELIGMYLHGSLANGDFDEHSDVDVIFVTKEEISDDMFSALHAMHVEIAEMDSPWAVQLEVSYIPEDALRRFDRSHIVHPHLDRGRGEVLHRMAHERDWIIQRHILRERGIRIAGPAPKALVDPISPDDLRMAIVDVLPLWLNPILENPSKINKRGYQSFFVLSLCRVIYTLRYGEIISKQVAAEWALDNLDSRWKPLIERALTGRQHPDLDADSEDIRETLEMMRYTLQQIRPTPYPEINEVLNLLLASAKEILGVQFVGMYLYGSLSSGDFDPDTSDVDFLVVTTDSLSKQKIARLESMHQQIWSSGLKWAPKFEGAYVPKELLRLHDPHGAPCPTVNEGRFYLASLGSDWILQRHIVREGGVVLEGPDPKTLIDTVSSQDLRSAVKGVLEEWWFPILEDPAWLVNHGSEYHAFAILTMCRALYALQHGAIVSKPAAAEWAQNQFGEHWRRVIGQALTAQKSSEGQPDLLNDALEFIRYTKDTLMV